LPESCARAARRWLAVKCAIYARGCEKRGKLGEAAYYDALGHQSSTLAAPGPVPPAGPSRSGSP
jgi:hypothetical protein